MFESNKNRYLTRGVHETIPVYIQLFIWTAIDQMPEPKDYLQVFHLEIVNGMQGIKHSSEEPDFHMTYVLAVVEKPVTAKIYVIDDGDHCTMLLAEEY